MRTAQSAGYLSYSEAIFEVFRLAGATRCTDGAKFHPIGAMVRVPKSEIFTEIWSKCGMAYPLRDFHKISSLYYVSGCISC